MDQEIVNLYNQNIPVIDICNQFSISFGKLYRVLSKYNIPKDKRKRVRKTKVDYKKISELYNNGIDINDISKYFNISNATIYNAIDANRGYKRKFSIDEEYFSNIDSEDKAYFLGLLYADGCNNGYGFYITLKVDDIDILYRFKDSIGFSGKLKYIKDNKYVMLNISSKKLSKVLSDYGCNINKTVNAIFPLIRSDLYRHFIRGLFDGDGSISIDKKNQAAFSIVGNSNIIHPVAEIINKECNLKVKIRKPKRYRCDISIYSFGGNRQAKRVREFLYKDSTLFLKRKYLKFKEI